MFFKNLAITGGLLAFAAFGAGAWSVDGTRRIR
jgi:putative oxidoreductase